MAYFFPVIIESWSRGTGGAMGKRWTALQITHKISDINAVENTIAIDIACGKQSARYSAIAT